MDVLWRYGVAEVDDGGGWGCGEYHAFHFADEGVGEAEVGEEDYGGGVHGWSVGCGVEYDDAGCKEDEVGEPGGGNGWYAAEVAGHDDGFLYAEKEKAGKEGYSDFGAESASFFLCGEGYAGEDDDE